jgi:hypothetical protein
MLKDRIENYKKLEEVRKSKLLVYFTSDRQGLETNIAADILPFFINHLDTIGDSEKITLYLYTRGGITLAAWSLVNLIRSFCKDFEVIVPFNCHSAGTLICLGADRIIMTKQATLGPIDPSTNGLMNPQIEFNNQKVRVPVSVEVVNGYLEMAKADFGIQNESNLTNIYLSLSEKIHPLSLGEVYRSKSQIQMLAKKLLKYQKIKDDKEQEVIKFLCSESGSHDYTIYRKEASETLGLNIEKPNTTLYDIIKAIYSDIENELELRNPFNPKIILAQQNPCNYSFRRALIESINGECDVFLSQGILSKIAINQAGTQQMGMQDNRTFEGWRHEKIS